MTYTYRSSVGRTSLPASSISSPWSLQSILLLSGVLAVSLYGMWVSSLLAMFAGALSGALLLPISALPATALWLLVLLPLNFTGMPQVASSYVTPAVLVIAIWMVRVALGNRMLPLLRVRIRGWSIILPLLALLIVSALLNTGHANTAIHFISSDPGRTPAWIAVFTICVLAPSVLGQISREDLWPTLQTSFAGIGLFLGVVAAVDFLFHFNPWSAVLNFEVREATWSVFRAKTSLGHPLLTATVASVALVVCVFPAGGIRRRLLWVGAFGALIALILSASRGGVVAVGFATFLGVFASRPSGKQSLSHGRGRLVSLIAAATILAIIAFSPLLTRRTGSSEGMDSGTYRINVFVDAIKLILERPMLGFGPGTSNTIFAEHYAGIDRVARLENSALQLLVSVGIPASLLCLLGLGLLIAIAIKRGRAGVVAGIAAFGVSLTGYNALEAIPAILALVAPLLFCAVMPMTSEGATTESSGEGLRYRPRLERVSVAKSK
ncbi:O-antigen ligase family protein [Mycolicibacterium sp. D5.8-2]|uniref:O-antigen ligase family protein n=1 Tax=Mycolicibacterium sp. D5.8-2 TaxID=3085903 RepID=UPI00298C2950|nr:O-antigen ligase family protein [Mycolicibacterium sp. D5.8-2]MDW5615071.1 O-antigen ligase family protein [Mycolicibacterium sp. D5.8-2]